MPLLICGPYAFPNLWSPCLYYVTCGPHARERSTKCTGTSTIEEEEDKREGKGRRCCLGYGIDSMTCRTIDLEPGLYEEKDE